jgi:Na+/melibiose symporter-like transporter
MIFEKYNIKQKTLKSLLGALIIKFSTSVTSCWGNINLYFLSMFYNDGHRITSATNSLILCISVIPMIISLLFATKLCNKFGYVFIIRLCCIIFFISPLVNLFVFSIYSFIIFCVVIPGSAFALSSIPILNCMWSQFP